MKQRIEAIESAIYDQKKAMAAIHKELEAEYSRLEDRFNSDLNQEELEAISDTMQPIYENTWAVGNLVHELGKILQRIDNLKSEL